MVSNCSISSSCSIIVESVLSYSSISRYVSSSPSYSHAIYLCITTDIEFICWIRYTDTDTTIISIDPVSDIELVRSSISDIWLDVISDKDILISGSEIIACMITESSIIVS